MVAVHVQVHQVLWQMVVHVPLPHTTWFTMCRSLWPPLLAGDSRKILSATRTPPAPSIFRSGRYWFQLGMHNPQRTTRAVVGASHFRYRASHIHARAHFELSVDLSSDFRVSQLRMPSSGRTNSAVA
jgi:hypothetical protein